jgi:hypothetical protein
MPNKEKKASTKKKEKEKCILIVEPRYNNIL